MDNKHLILFSLSVIGTFSIIVLRYNMPEMNWLTLPLLVGCVLVTFLTVFRGTK